ncbi:MAG TPA: PIN domain-containing protein [Tepidisphaeraceae bacterium]
MILLDTSVLVRYLRTHDAKIKAVFDSQRIAVSVVTRAEILHGARDDQDFRRLTAALDGFVQVTVDDVAWADLAVNLYKLRLRGTPVPFPDALIATVAIQRGLELWTFDSDFTLMQAALPALRLYPFP